MLDDDEFDIDDIDGELFEQAMREELRELSETEELDWLDQQNPFGRDQYNGTRFED